ncbi:MAG: hypothetical protein QOJ56_4062, partial [Mycobacterium sp.]|nr:hypothetical protein [Mycobacterium sp.]
MYACDLTALRYQRPRVPNPDRTYNSSSTQRQHRKSADPQPRHRIHCDASPLLGLREVSALAALHSGHCLPGIDCGADSELSRSG